MPKCSKSGLKRPIMNIENISYAIEDIERGMTIEMAAKKHMVAKTTLWRHYKKHQMSSTTNNPNQRRVYETGNTSVVATASKQVMEVFSDEEEIFLAEYIKSLSKLKYDLSQTDVMKFAYLIAQKIQKVIPASWSVNGCADREWLMSFLKRHPQIPAGSAGVDDDDDGEQTEDGEETKNVTIVPSIQVPFTLQKAKECLSLLLYNQIYNIFKNNNEQMSQR